MDKPAPYDEAVEDCYSPTGLPTTGCCSLYKSTSRSTVVVVTGPIVVRRVSVVVVVGSTSLSTLMTPAETRQNRESDHRRQVEFQDDMFHT